MNSSNFDVPQNRVRIYIVGVLGKKPHITLNSDLGAADTHKHKKVISVSQEGLFDEKACKPKTIEDILESTPNPKYRCTEDFTSRLQKVVGDDFNSLHGYRLIDYRGGRSLHSWELGVKGDCTGSEIEVHEPFDCQSTQKDFWHTSGWEKFD